MTCTRDFFDCDPSMRDVVIPERAVAAFEPRPRQQSARKDNRAVNATAPGGVFLAGLAFAFTTALSLASVTATGPSVQFFSQDAVHLECMAQTPNTDFDAQLERSWNSALDILRAQGEDVDVLLRDAGRVVSYYFESPTSELPEATAGEEDEV